MNKSLIALAVAGLAASPLAVHAAAHTDGLSIGATMTMAYKMGDAVDEVISDDNSITFSGADDLGNGMEAYGNIRLDLTTTGSTPAGDNVVAGVRGDFGDIGIGEVQNGLDYAQRANDIIDISTAQNQAIGYKNTIGDVTFAVSTSPDGNFDGNTYGAQFNIGMFTIGAGVESGPDVDVTGFGASAEFGDFGVDVHSASADDDDDTNVTAFRGRWASGALSASFTSASQTADSGDLDKTRLDVGYALSGRTSVHYRNETSDVDADEYSWILLSVNLGDNS